MASLQAPAAVLALAGVACCGCATVTRGPTASVTLDTKPSGAVCMLTRGGQTIAAVNPTPGTVMVEKSRVAIAVSCKKDGYKEAAGVVESEFQPMTFGNILLGGLIGVAVDAASGAMTTYQPSVVITLIPERFASPAERDVFFDGLRAELEGEVAKLEERIRKNCTDPQRCQTQLKAAQIAKEGKLLQIEKKRALAEVADGSATK